MPTVRGKPRGLCSECRRNEDRKVYARQGFQRFPRAQNLEAYNYELLSSSAPGTYALFSRTTGEQINGWIAVKPASIFVRAFGLYSHCYIDLTGVAAFLANQNLVLSRYAVRITQPGTKEVVPLEQVGEHVAKSDIRNRMNHSGSIQQQEPKSKAKIDELRNCTIPGMRLPALFLAATQQLTSPKQKLRFRFIDGSFKDIEAGDLLRDISLLDNNSYLRDIEIAE